MRRALPGRYRPERQPSKRIAAAVAAILVWEGIFASGDLIEVAEAAPQAPPAAATEAADIPSAVIAARLSGKRVEALAARTETSTTWANPDGTLTTDSYAGPMRYKAGDKWIETDATLLKLPDGSVAPRSQPSGLKLTASDAARSARADAPRDLASIGSGEHQVTLQWKGALPEPVLAGPKATYRDALPGADVIVEATRTGFEQYVELKHRNAGASSYTLPLKTTGAKVNQQPDGSVVFTDRKTGVPLGTMPQPEMWDSTVDARTGEHTRRAPVGLKVVPTATGADLVLTPDAKFLADPATRFPVMVDPATSSVYGAFDAFVQEGYNTDQSAATELKLGNNGSGQVAQSFINWNTSAIAGKQVTAATLNLWNHHSWSGPALPRTGRCTPPSWRRPRPAGRNGRICSVSGPRSPTRPRAVRAAPRVTSPPTSPRWCRAGRTRASPPPGWA